LRTAGLITRTPAKSVTTRALFLAPADDLVPTVGVVIQWYETDTYVHVLDGNGPVFFCGTGQQSLTWTTGAQHSYGYM